MSDPAQPRLTITVCDAVSLAQVLVRRGSAAAVSAALRARFGIALPAPGRLVAAGLDQLLWSGPDRFLAVGEADGAGMTQELPALLAGLGYAVAVSDSRVVLQVEGDGVVAALNRVLPVDLHPRAFTPGSVALTTAGHVAVQIWRPGEAALFRLACGSSYAASFRRRLAAACFGEAEPQER